MPLLQCIARTQSLMQAPVIIVQADRTSAMAGPTSQMCDQMQILSA